MGGSKPFPRFISMKKDKKQYKIKLNSEEFNVFFPGTYSFGISVRPEIILF